MTSDGATPFNVAEPLLLIGRSAKLADHLNVVFYGSDIIYIDRKNGHLCLRPPSGRVGVPFPLGLVGSQQVTGFSFVLLYCYD